MSIETKNETVHAIGNAWTQLKNVNDRRLSAERKGAADPLDEIQVKRINETLDNYKRRFEAMETAANRPMKEIECAYKSGADNFEYKKAFEGYIRKGAVTDLEAFEKKALSVASDPDGGYLVTPTLSQQIEKYVFETSPMRQLASVEQISTDSLDIIVDNNEAGAGWVAESAARSDTTTPQITKKTIGVHEIYAQPKATQKLIDDSAIDIEAWVAEKVAEIFSSKENTAFISGDGSGKPKGILSYAAGTSYGQIQQVLSGSNGAVLADSLVQLYYSLKDEYAKNATFLMNRATVQAVRLLKEETTQQYIWQPGLALGAPDTLMGIPLKQASDMPVPANDSLSIALADFSKAYKIVDRVGIRVLRDPFTDKPFVKFYTTKRVGGEVVNFDAIKLLKLADE